jgi:hypothetical protein
MKPTVSLSKTRRREGRVSARTGVEGGEYACIRHHARVGHRVEQGGFAALVGSPPCQRPERNRVALPPVRLVRYARLQIVAQHLDFAPDSAPVGFEFGFTGTARADSASQTRHLFAVAGQARLQVHQLGQFHLQAAFPRAGAAREDVEDQLCPIQHSCRQGVFEVALLCGRQIVVEHHQIGAKRTRQRGQFTDLALAQQRGGIGRLARLADAVQHQRACARSQLSQFVEGFFGIARAERPGLFSFQRRRAALPLDAYQNRALVHNSQNAALAPGRFRLLARLQVARQP